MFGLQHYGGTSLEPAPNQSVNHYPQAVPLQLTCAQLFKMYCLQNGCKLYKCTALLLLDSRRLNILRCQNLFTLGPLYFTNLSGYFTIALGTLSLKCSLSSSVGRFIVIVTYLFIKHAIFSFLASSSKQYLTVLIIL